MAHPMPVEENEGLRSPSAVLKELRRQAREAGITEADIVRAIAAYRARTSSAQGAK